MASASTPASVYTCKCLNVTIHVQTGIGVDAEPTFEIVNPRDFRELDKDHLAQKIFQGSTEVARVKLDISGVRYEQALLFTCEIDHEWNFFHCLNCKTATHCIRFKTVSDSVGNASKTSSMPSPQPSPEHILLINVTHLIGDQKKIQQLKQSQDFSPLFRIILPTTWGSTNSSERWRSNSGSDGSSSTTPLSPTVSSFQQSLPMGRRLSGHQSPSMSQDDPVYTYMSGLFKAATEVLDGQRNGHGGEN